MTQTLQLQNKKDSTPLPLDRVAMERMLTAYAWISASSSATPKHETGASTMRTHGGFSQPDSPRQESSQEGSEVRTIKHPVSRTQTLLFKMKPEQICEYRVSESNGSPTALTNRTSAWKAVEAPDQAQVEINSLDERIAKLVMHENRFGQLKLVSVSAPGLIFHAAPSPENETPAEAFAASLDLLESTRWIQLEPKTRSPAAHLNFLGHNRGEADVITVTNGAELISNSFSYTLTAQSQVKVNYRNIDGDVSKLLYLVKDLRGQFVFMGTQFMAIPGAEMRGSRMPEVRLPHFSQDTDMRPNMTVARAGALPVKGGTQSSSPGRKEVVATIPLVKDARADEVTSAALVNESHTASHGRNGLQERGISSMLHANADPSHDVAMMSVISRDGAMKHLGSGAHLDRDSNFTNKLAMNAEVGANIASHTDELTLEAVKQEQGGDVQVTKGQKALKSVAPRVFQIPEELKEQTRSEMNRRRMNLQIRERQKQVTKQRQVANQSYHLQEDSLVSSHGTQQLSFLVNATRTQHRRGGGSPLELDGPAAEVSLRQVSGPASRSTSQERPRLSTINDDSNVHTVAQPPMLRADRLDGAPYSPTLTMKATPPLHIRYGAFSPHPFQDVNLSGAKGSSKDSKHRRGTLVKLDASKVMTTGQRSVDSVDDLPGPSENDGDNDDKTKTLGRLPEGPLPSDAVRIIKSPVTKSGFQATTVIRSLHPSSLVNSGELRSASMPGGARMSGNRGGAVFNIKETSQMHSQSSGKMEEILRGGDGPGASPHTHIAPHALFKGPALDKSLGLIGYHSLRSTKFTCAAGGNDTARQMANVHASVDTTSPKKGKPVTYVNADHSCFTSYPAEGPRATFSSISAAFDENQVNGVVYKHQRAKQLQSSLANDGITGAESNRETQAGPSCLFTPPNMLSVGLPTANPISPKRISTAGVTTGAPMQSKGYDTFQNFRKSIFNQLDEVDRSEDSSPTLAGDVMERTQQPFSRDQPRERQSGKDVSRDEEVTADVAMGSSEMIDVAETVALQPQSVPTTSPTPVPNANSNRGSPAIKKHPFGKKKIESSPQSLTPLQLQETRKTQILPQVNPRQSDIPLKAPGLFAPKFSSSIVPDQSRSIIFSGQAPINCPEARAASLNVTQKQRWSTNVSPSIGWKKFVQKRHTHGPKLPPTAGKQQLRKFEFVHKLNQHEDKKGQMALERREAGGFIPYLSERDPQGRLIHSEEPGQQDRREVLNEDGEVIDFDDGHGPLWRQQMKDAAAILNNLDLHQAIRAKAAQKRRDPIKGSTQMNRLKIEKNVKLRIKNQVEFSKRCNLVEASDEEAPELTENQHPLILQEQYGGPFSKSSHHMFLPKQSANKTSDAFFTTKFTMDSTRLPTTRKSGAPSDAHDGVQQLTVPMLFNSVSKRTKMASVLEDAAVAFGSLDSTAGNSPAAYYGLQQETLNQDATRSFEQMANQGFATQRGKDMEKRPAMFGASNLLGASMQAIGPRKFEEARELQHSQVSTQINFNKFDHAEAPSTEVMGSTVQQSPRADKITQNSRHRPSKSVFVPDTSAVMERQMTQAFVSQFKIFLPHSRAYLYKHPGQGLEYVDVNRPRVYLKQDTQVMFSPKLTDIHKAKEKYKTKIMYYNQQGAINSKELVERYGDKKEIPETLLTNRRDEYIEYPGHGELDKRKPVSCIPTTFSTAQRFNDPKVLYNDANLPISPIDFEHVFHNTNARTFKGYSERKDLLLTKSQENLLAIMKEEQYYREQRMQAMREEHDNKKEREAALMPTIRAPGSKLNEDGTRPIRFSYEEHKTVIDVRKPMRKMFQMIRQTTDFELAAAHAEEREIRNNARAQAEKNQMKKMVF